MTGRYVFYATLSLIQRLIHRIQALAKKAEFLTKQVVAKAVPDLLHNGYVTDGLVLLPQNLLDKSQMKDPPKDHATVYGCSEKERGTLEVPLQELYKGPRQVLTSEAASTPISTLGPEGLLERMNSYLGTTFVLDEARKSLLETTIEALQDLKYAKDFGFAYALLRPRWNLDPQQAIQEIHEQRDMDDTERRNPIKGRWIARGSREVGPRRVWDLWSNRVIPSWMARRTWEMGIPLDVGWWFAVSHVWMEKPESVDSPINGHQWLVPIPRETNLDRVRTELLHVTSEDMQYAWLDVLCLRQKKSIHVEKESVLAEEWEVDIPIIGSIYTHAKTVVYYYSGLGLPFQIGDVEYGRHWLKRAWTLQEHRSQGWVAGMSKHTPRLPHLGDRWYIPTDDSVREFCQRMARLPNHKGTFGRGRSFLHIVDEMRSRFAHEDSEIDRIAGLVSFSGGTLHGILTQKHTKPTYILGEKPENAWQRLVQWLNNEERGDIMFYTPEAGPGTKESPAWCPTWQQAMEKTATVPSMIIFGGHIQFDNDRHEYWMDDSKRVECNITGFAEPVAKDKREGKVAMRSKHGSDWLDFSATADHRQPIPDGRYTLLVGQRINIGMRVIDPFTGNMRRCVVGRTTKSGAFEKITVIDYKEDRAQWDNVFKIYGRVGLV